LLPTPSQRSRPNVPACSASFLSHYKSSASHWFTQHKSPHIECSRTAVPDCDPLAASRAFRFCKSAISTSVSFFSASICSLTSARSTWSCHGADNDRVLTRGCISRTVATPPTLASARRFMPVQRCPMGGKAPACQKHNKYYSRSVAKCISAGHGGMPGSLPTHLPDGLDDLVQLLLHLE
jgi:hypothetical protein